MTILDPLTPRQRQLADALAAAKQAALAAQPGDDGGSANLDCAFLYTRRGLTDAGITKAAEAAGASVSRYKGLMWNGWFVQVGAGQGTMNTRMAVAACKALQEAGEHATVYYQLD